MSSFETVKKRGRNLLIYGGITAMTGAALLGIGGSAFAQDSTPTAGTSAATATAGDSSSTTATDRAAARQAEYDAFLDKLAANLGVADGATVDAAIKTTLKQMVDEQLAAGDISANDAQAIKDAIDSGDYPLNLHFGGRGGPRDGVFHGSDREKGADDANDGDNGADDVPAPGASTPTAGSGASA